MIEKIVAQTLGVDQDAVKDEAHFVNDLGADSLNIVELVMNIEGEYDVEVPDDEAENIHTVAQLKQWIEENA